MTFAINIGRRLQASFVLSLLFLISGCASPLLLENSKPILQPGEGLVFCSFSFEVSDDKYVNTINGLTGVTLILRRLGTDKKIDGLNTSTGIVAGAWWNQKISKTEKGRTSAISAIALPAGEYELVSSDIYVTYDQIYATSIPMDRPFKFIVKDNEATYLGAHEFRHITGKYLLGPAKRPSKIRMFVSDRFNEDSEMLKNARPDTETIPKINVTII